MFLLIGGCLLCFVGIGVMYFGAVSNRRRRGRRARRIGICLFVIGAVMLIVAMFANLFDFKNDASPTTSNRGNQTMTQLAPHQYNGDAA